MINAQMIKKATAVAILAIVFFAATSSRGVKADNLRVEEQNGKFSIQARQAPLLKLLSDFGGLTEASFFLADSIASQPVDVTCKDVSLVRALQCVLKGFDFVASFSKNAKGEEVISLVKIYPKGNRTGNLIKVAAKDYAEQAKAVGTIPRSLAEEQRISRELYGAPVRPEESVLQRSGKTYSSRISGSSVLIAKRDFNQQLGQHLQKISREEWGIQHSRPVDLSGSSETTSNKSTSEETASDKTTLGETSSIETTPLAIPLLAESGIEKVQAETMQDEVNSGLDRLQYLQQSDDQTFVVTLMVDNAAR